MSYILRRCGLYREMMDDEVCMGEQARIFRAFFRMRLSGKAD